MLTTLIFGPNLIYLYLNNLLLFHHSVFPLHPKPIASEFRDTLKYERVEQASPSLSFVLFLVKFI